MSRDNPSYWLFIVLEDKFPGVWKRMVDCGIAAQHYPAGWNNETRNINALKRLKRGDWIVAALKKHRFAGYGQLETDFAQQGPSLMRNHASRERFGIDWSVIPFQREPRYVTCRDLKDQGYSVSLLHGQCVTQTDRRTFERLRARCDQAGAVPVRRQQSHVHAPVHQVISLEEGGRAIVQMERAERNARLRRECLTAHGTRCAVCGMSFEESYGSVGRGYIEVHHLHPLGRKTGRRLTDPISDLRPVCPNCHAMLHRNDPPYTITAMRRHLKLPTGPPARDGKEPRPSRPR